MASRAYETVYGMEQHLVEANLTFTTEEGSTSGANYVLPIAKVKAGLCTYEVNLVVSNSKI